MKGVIHSRLDFYLDEFMYRYRYGFENGDVFEKLLTDIAEYQCDVTNGC